MITHKITLDYQQLAACRQVLYVKQYDYMSRTVEITLTNGGAEYTIPDDFTGARLAFRKPDGHGGVYSQINGEDAFAFADDRQSVTITMHPQMMTCAGTVECELQLVGADIRLSTFKWQLVVECAAEGEGDPSEDYYSVPGIHGLQAITTVADGDEIALYDVSAGITKKATAAALAGTSDHAQLRNRDAVNSHPQSAITGLVSALAAKYEKPSDGIPAEDLSLAVRNILDGAVIRFYNASPSGDGVITRSNLIPAENVFENDIILTKNNKLGYITEVLPQLKAAFFAGNFLSVDTPEVDAVLKSAQAAKTAAMTQRVGIDSDGKLWVPPAGQGGGTEVITVTVSGFAASMSASEIAAEYAAGNIVQLDYGDGIIAPLVMLGQNMADFAVIAPVDGVASVCVAEITGTAYQSGVVPIGGGTASSVTITDTAGYFASGNVEGALAEIGAQLDGLADALEALL